MKIKLRIWTDDTIPTMVKCLKTNKGPIYCLDEARQRCKGPLTNPSCYKKCKPYNVIVDITKEKK